MLNTRQVLESRKAELQRKRHENGLLRRQMAEFGDRIVEASQSLLVAKEASAFLERLAGSRRRAMKSGIESVVTEAVRMIYDSSYRAELTYGMKGNRSNLTVEMVRQTPEGEIRREIGGFGGGMADTIAATLRIMVLVGARQTDRVCVLDECWKHMDVGRIPQVAEFLKVLCDRLGVQVVFCSHHDGIRDHADVVYEIGDANGVSEVRRMSRGS